MRGTLQQMRRLETHRALLASGGGETVRQIAKRLKVAHSYAHCLLKRLVEAGEIDRVEVIVGEKACIVYYTRWTEEIYESEAYSLIARVF